MFFHIIQFCSYLLNLNFGVFTAIKEESKMHFFNSCELFDLFEPDLYRILFNYRYDLFVTVVADLDEFIIFVIMIQAMKMSEFFANFCIVRMKPMKATHND